MRKSLTIKTFAIILSGFLTIILLISMFQFIYFNVFYEKDKISGLLNAFDAFALEFEKGQWSDEQYINETNEFSINNSATIYFYYDDANYADYFEDEIYHQITLETSDSQYYNIFLYSDEDYDNAVVSNNLKVGQDALVSGFTDNMFSFIPSAINNVPVNEYDLEYFDYTEIGYESVTDNFTIADIRSFDMSDFYAGFEYETDDSAYYNTVDVSSLDTLGDTYSEKGIDYVITQYPGSDLKQVDFYKEMTVNGDQIVLYANASLQAVDEVLAFNHKNYPYFIAIALLLSIIIALISSRHVAKPIVEITSVADEMTEMNFNVKSNIRRKDEIGRLSDSLNILAGELERNVSQLTSANIQLQEDFEEITRQEKIRKEFVANVSHELKTPIGVIKSYTEGIKDGIKQEKQDYYVDVILDETEKMNTLVLELLELSKLDAGKARFIMTTFNPVPVIEDCIETLKHQLKSCDLDVQLDIKPGMITTDISNFEHVILNLLDNACKYADKKSPLIIKGGVEDAHLNLSMENKCTPLSDEALSHIWDRFYKSDTSHDRTYTGSGLGLSIVKSILNALGGEIHARSLEDGIIFELTI